MLTPITIRYDFRPVRRSLATGQIADLFGLGECEPPHTVAENVASTSAPATSCSSPARAGRASRRCSAPRLLNSGRSTLALSKLPDVPLIDALPRPDRGAARDPRRLRPARGAALAPHARRAERGGALSLPAGVRAGRRLALHRLRRVHRHARPHAGEGGRVQRAEAGCREPASVCWPRRRTPTSSTTSNPTCWCAAAERVNPTPSAVVGTRPISFADELSLAEGTQADWKRFARWHYRGSDLAFTRRIVLLRHRDEPIGICVFGAPAAALALRSRYFGLTNPRSSRGARRAQPAALAACSAWCFTPPIAARASARRSSAQACESCPVKWIETLSAMGHASPFFERAGFTRVGVVEPRSASRERSGVCAVRWQASAASRTRRGEERPQRPGVLRLRQPRASLQCRDFVSFPQPHHGAAMTTDREEAVPGVPRVPGAVHDLRHPDPHRDAVPARGLHRPAVRLSEQPRPRAAITTWPMAISDTIP